MSMVNSGGSNGARYKMPQKQGQRRRRGPTKNKIYGFVGLALLAVLVIGAILYLVLPGKNMNAGVKSINFSITSNGVIIRNEACYNAEDNYGRALFKANEGAAVEQGATVASVYRWGYTDDIMQALYDAQSQVSGLQRQLLSGISTPEIDSADAKIKAIIDEARAVISGSNDYTDLLQEEVKLKAAMAERDALLTAKTQANDQLQALYQAETLKQETLSSWATDIIAAEGGLISFYSDGFEPSINIANANKAKYLSSTLVSKALSMNNVIVTAANSSQAVYRIVHDGMWYWAFLSNADSPTRVVVGQQYNVTFSGYETQAYVGTAVSADVSGQKVVNVLRFDSPLGDFINLRSVSATVKQEFSGVSVRTRAICYDNGLPYIVVLKNNEEYRLYIDIMASGKTYSVVAAKNGEVFVEGQQYIIPKKASENTSGS